VIGGIAALGAGIAIATSGGRSSKPANQVSPSPSIATTRDRDLIGSTSPSRI
jgi:hypothetical protein